MGGGWSVCEVCVMSACEDEGWEWVERLRSYHLVGIPVLIDRCSRIPSRLCPFRSLHKSLVMRHKGIIRTRAHKKFTCFRYNGSHHWFAFLHNGVFCGLCIDHLNSMLFSTPTFSSKC